MNCPSRTDDNKDPTYNQSPTALAADLTVREDLNNRANVRVLLSNTNQGSSYEKDTTHITKTILRESTFDRDSDFSDDDDYDKNFERIDYEKELAGKNEEKAETNRRDEEKIKYQLRRSRNITDDEKGYDEKGYKIRGDNEEKRDYLKSKLEYLSDIKLSKENVWNILATVKGYLKFVGPGFMISVAYIDPGNYSVNVTAGATFRFRLLYMGLISNLFSIFYHGLCVKLGSVTGLNLAEACRAFLPSWLNLILYLIAEISIIATDVTEVIGTGIAVSLLLPKIQLQLACAISILDVIFIRLISTPGGNLKGLRAFEFSVMALVVGVVVCFCIQLCMIQSPSLGEVLSGYIPADELLHPQGLYQACGILGSTLMPHSLYLGSGLIQPRLKQFDLDNGLISLEPDLSRKDRRVYKPSPEAIDTCMRVFITEVVICLFIFALFVNSAILIIAGSSLYDTPGSIADLFGVHDVLSNSVGPVAGFIFAFALLLSGGSAAIICTLAGQMISTGAVHGTISPWLRRLLTRVLTTLPSIIIASISGRQGLDDVLDAAQVVLSIMLPFTVAPLIFFTSMDRYMTVRTPVNRIKSQSDARSGSVSWDAEARPPIEIKMGNHWFTTTIAISIWLFIIGLNGANIFSKFY